VKLLRKHEGNLQVQRLRLERRRGPSFTIFPMIHIADHAFYQQVSACADTHDMVLKEGSRTAAGRSADRSHAIASAGHPTLAGQSKSMQESTGAHWVNSDLAPEKFNRHWQRIPVFRRALFHIVMPLLGLALRFPTARRGLIDGLADGPQASSEGLDDIFGEGFHDVVVKRRDKALIDACDHTIKIWEDGDVAVVWGTAHIPPLVMSLIGKHGYRITERTWMTVLSAPGEPAQPVENSSRA